MGSIKVRYLIKRRQKAGHDLYYWYPKKEYREAGFKPRPLGKDAVKAALAAEDLNASLDAWRKGDALPVIKGSVIWLIRQYQASDWFAELRDSTQKMNKYVFGSIEQFLIQEKLEHALAEDFDRQLAKMLYHNFSAKVRKAELVVSLLRVAFSYGIEIGLLKENPFHNLRIKKPKPRQQIWEDDQIVAFKAKAHEMEMPSIALAIQLAYDIGQRPADLRALTWSRYNGTTIKLRQSKTDVWIEVPIMKELKVMLDNAERKSPVILITEATGKPYTKDMLSRRIREVAKAAGIPDDLQMRDLRRTAVVRLAEHGCEIPDIAAITGHELRSVLEIMKTYLPVNSRMAKRAINMIEAAEKLKGNVK